MNVSIRLRALCKTKRQVEFFTFVLLTNYFLHFVGDVVLNEAAYVSSQAESHAGDFLILHTEDFLQVDEQMSRAFGHWFQIVDGLKVAGPARQHLPVGVYHIVLLSHDVR